ncbi:hypothetical protein ACIOKD_01515 [Streptomyces sp. NPDC087844]|uniref:hypothetical protein n=1 Tax=Streptomyces sp. NPDC087844 TaxID=3365805 RepID=UPI0038014BCB
MNSLDYAEQLLIGRCMSRHGIPYVVPAPRDLLAQRSFPYVVDDIAWARAQGYGGKEQRRIGVLRERDPNERYFRSLSAHGRTEALTVLMGAQSKGVSAKAPTGMTLTTSNHGCIAEAQRALYGDLNTWFRVQVVTTNLQPLYVPKVRADSRYKKALGQWASCMKAAGQPYDTPGQARETAAKRAAAQSPEEADKSSSHIAVAEATCARSTPLSKVVADLDRYYGDRVRARYRKDVTDKRRLQNAALPRARDVIAREHG